MSWFLVVTACVRPCVEALTVYAVCICCFEYWIRSGRQNPIRTVPLIGTRVSNLVKYGLTLTTPCVSRVGVEVRRCVAPVDPSG
ncbi:hypothetical protein GGS26DRAFT_574976 [Hypomontagnella submonticulosa]|nr:hypothetical protein GGS26DRAFT_574976 [Hypomontagnella submonticulosa]